MGSTHTTSTTTVRRTAAVTGVAAILGLAACAGGGGGDDDAAASATAPAMDMAATAATDRPADDAGFGVVGRAEAEATEAPAPAAPAPSSGGETTTLQPVGQQLAIAAHATMQTDDVRAAVERITTTVAARGGRVASADIDYASPTDDEAATSRATLVVAIPPGELAAVRSVLEDAGDVLSYDQLAEDVTDQLADLDTRIANQRASIERIRELYANAVDVDAVVRIEAELTSRETVLEQLLATQQQITDRVAMSTLTIDVTTAPVDEELPAAGGTGLGDALAAGWSAFAGGLFAIVLGLTAAMPFVLTLLVIAAVALWVRALSRRRGAPPARRGDQVTAEREPEPVPASRRE
jgi:hypothetical protein